MTNVSRRTVAKGAAWAVPVVAVGAATPAMAASGQLITFNGLGCKLPGRSNVTYKGYAFDLTVNNPGAPVTVTIVSITLNGVDIGPAVVALLPPNDFDPDCDILGTENNAVLPTGQYEVALATANATDSANGTLVVTYRIDGGEILEATVTVDATPPINGASCTTFTQAQKDCLSGLNAA